MNGNEKGHVHAFMRQTNLFQLNLFNNLLQMQCLVTADPGMNLHPFYERRLFYLDR